MTATVAAEESIDMAGAPLLRVRNLVTEYRTRGGAERVVNSVDLDISNRETVGLVGESGCGKSQTALSIMGLVDRTLAEVSGEVWFRGLDLLQLPAEQFRQLRGREIAMIFQDPLSALNPVLTIGEQLGEAIRVHEDVGRTWGALREITMIHRFERSERRRQDRAAQLLDEVQVPDGRIRLRQYPHQFSGGMRQRVMIAMALAWNPALLIADEPTTALDVTIQAQILDLLHELQRLHGLAVLLITHDLGVVSENCDRVNVMYAGRIVERAPTPLLFAAPTHPYTRGLIDASPSLETSERALQQIEGVAESGIAYSAGCPFRHRCSHALSICSEEFPGATNLGAGHEVWCHNP